MFQKIDCVILRVSDLDEGLAFYSHTLGHKLLWRTPDAAGLAMADTDAELVLHTKTGPEVDLLVPELALPSRVSRRPAESGSASRSNCRSAWRLSCAIPSATC